MIRLLVFSNFVQNKTLDFYPMNENFIVNIFVQSYNRGKSFCH